MLACRTLYNTQFWASSGGENQPVAILEHQEFSASKYLHERVKCFGSVTQNILRHMWKGTRGRGGE
jgi:hypothetical protein